VYLDIGVADTAFKAPGERTLGDRTVIPEPKAALGRIEIGAARQRRAWGCAGRQRAVRCGAWRLSCARRRRASGRRPNGGPHRAPTVRTADPAPPGGLQSRGSRKPPRPPTRRAPPSRVRAPGLYGNACPATTANFLAAVRSGALAGTVVSRISLGEYIQLGRQGSRRMGEVEGVEGLQVRCDGAGCGEAGLHVS
jgi:hypothetical protein